MPLQDTHPIHAFGGFGLRGISGSLAERHVTMAHWAEGLSEESNMGLVHVKVEVSNPAAPETGEEIAMLVDTGVTISVLPASLLDRLGVRREGTRNFRGFGGNLTRDTGIVRFTYEEVTAGVPAVWCLEWRMNPSSWE